MKSRHLLCLAVLPLFVVACQKAPEQVATPEPAAKASPVATASTPTLDSDVEVYSYGVGFQIGSQMAASPLEMNSENVIAGLKAGLAKSESLVSQERMQEVAQRFQAEMAAKQQAEAEVLSKDNAAAAEAFLAANASKEGVTVLDNGLQYRIIENTDGAKPGAADTVVVHYRGTFIDGTEFDSSYSRNEPAEFPLNAVIPGWQQALQLMPVGSKWEVFIPPALGYGSGGQGPIPPSSALIFEVELMEIKPAEPEAEQK